MSTINEDVAVLLAEKEQREASEIENIISLYNQARLDKLVSSDDSKVTTSMKFASYDPVSDNDKLNIIIGFFNSLKLKLTNKNHVEINFIINILDSNELIYDDKILLLKDVLRCMSGYDLDKINELAKELGPSELGAKIVKNILDGISPDNYVLKNIYSKVNLSYKLWSRRDITLEDVLSHIFDENNKVDGFGAEIVSLLNWFNTELTSNGKTRASIINAENAKKLLLLKTIAISPFQNPVTRYYALKILFLNNADKKEQAAQSENNIFVRNLLTQCLRKAAFYSHNLSELKKVKQVVERLREEKMQQQEEIQRRVKAGRPNKSRLAVIAGEAVPPVVDNGVAAGKSSSEPSSLSSSVSSLSDSQNSPRTPSPTGLPNVLSDNTKKGEPLTRKSSDGASPSVTSPIAQAQTSHEGSPERKNSNGNAELVMFSLDDENPLSPEEAARKAEELRIAKENAERKAQEEAAKQVIKAAARGKLARTEFKEEAERKAREETQRKAQEETERKAQEEAERKAQEEAAKQIIKAAARGKLARTVFKEEAERKTQEEAAKQVIKAAARGKLARSVFKVEAERRELQRQRLQLIAEIRFLLEKLIIVKQSLEELGRDIALLKSADVVGKISTSINKALQSNDRFGFDKSLAKISSNLDELARTDLNGLFSALKGIEESKLIKAEKATLEQWQATLQKTLNESKKKEDEIKNVISGVSAFKDSASLAVLNKIADSNYANNNTDRKSEYIDQISGFIDRLHQIAVAKKKRFDDAFVVSHVDDPDQIKLLASAQKDGKYICTKDHPQLVALSKRWYDFFTPSRWRLERLKVVQTAFEDSRASLECEKYQKYIAECKNKATDLEGNKQQEFTQYVENIINDSQKFLGATVVPKDNHDDADSDLNGSVDKKALGKKSVTDVVVQTSDKQSFGDELFNLLKGLKEAADSYVEHNVQKKTYESLPAIQKEIEAIEVDPKKLAVAKKAAEEEEKRAAAAKEEEDRKATLTPRYVKGGAAVVGKLGLMSDAQKEQNRSKPGNDAQPKADQDKPEKKSRSCCW